MFEAKQVFELFKTGQKVYDQIYILLKYDHL